MLLIDTPDTHAPERDYVLGVVLDEFLGLPWRRRVGKRADVRVAVEGEEGELLLPDVLLSSSADDWLRPASMPSRPLSLWRPHKRELEEQMVSRELPIIYGDPAFSLHKSPNRLCLPIDIFGFRFA